MKSIKNIFIIAFTFFCLTSIFACSMKPGKNTLYTPFPSNNYTNTIELPSENMSKVIFVWWRKYKSALPNTLFDNGEVIGANEIDSFFEYKCNPGKHIFASGADLRALDFVEADLLPGHIYYIYTNQVPGWYVTGNIIPVCPTCKNDIWAALPKKFNGLKRIELSDKFNPWREKNKEIQTQMFRDGYEVWLKKQNKNKILPEYGFKNAIM